MIILCEEEKKSRSAGHDHIVRSSMLSRQKFRAVITITRNVMVIGIAMEITSHSHGHFVCSFNSFSLGDSTSNNKCKNNSNSNSGSNGNSNDNHCRIFQRQVRAGDFIVMGTDGLFDNLGEQEICHRIVQVMCPQTGVVERQEQSADLSARSLADPGNLLSPHLPPPAVPTVIPSFSLCRFRPLCIDGGLY